MSKKIDIVLLKDTVRTVLKEALLKKRKFLESVETQIRLKQSANPFKTPTIIVVAPYTRRAKVKACLIANDRHIIEAKANDIPYINYEECAEWKKDKKSD
eukprot:TRINITY_DN3981_c0_g1_i1.p2 TRINITY_DN3981_c0_g1~~TRINITY_DN3981_c0_g1_i1.p2  ORF type:complete len:113 (+),score=27.84 TRINITY_DN3981_c0_g1_i1:42-341(+)